MKIGIIGVGNVGGALGKLWAAKGHEIVFGVRDPGDGKVAALLASIGGGARAGTVADAAASAEIVILATPWPATREVIRSAGDLTGKIVIDCTNPLAADLSGLSFGTSDSGGEQVSRWAHGAHVVKAFNTTGTPVFSDPHFGRDNAGMFIAGNDAGSKIAVRALAAELGFDVVDCGPLSASRWLEPLGMLWIHLAFHQELGPMNHAFKLLRR